MKNKSIPPVNQILHLEADINYTIFHFNNGTKTISSYTMKRYAESVELSGFVRVSRKYLVNPTEIINIKIEDKIRFVVLKNGQELRMSRRANL